MKIWKWYKNLTDEQYDSSSNLALEDKYPLYAFTNNKKYKELFREMRKKEAFIEMKDYMTDEEYVKFANKYRGLLLDMHPFSRIIGRNGREPKFQDVPILTTWDEKDMTEAAIQSFSDSGSGMGVQEYPFSPIIFREKYFNALHILQYVDHWKLFTTNDISSYEEQMMQKLGVDIDYSYPDLRFDEFKVFINLYSDILKL